MTLDPVAAEGVRFTIAAYALALDDGRTGDLVATFCDDGVVELPGFGVFKGHDAISAAFAKWKPVRPQRHLVVNTLISERRGDEVDAVSDLLFTVHDGSGWTIQLVGRYHDTLRMVDGRWLFARRVMRVEEG